MGKTHAGGVQGFQPRATAERSASSRVVAPAGLCGEVEELGQGQAMTANSSERQRARHVVVDIMAKTRIPTAPIIHYGSISSCKAAESARSTHGLGRRRGKRAVC